MGRPPTQDDLSAILVIYNDAVLNSTAIWNDRVVDLENRADVANLARNVCFRGESRHADCSAKPPLMTQSGHATGLIQINANLVRKWLSRAANVG